MIKILHSADWHLDSALNGRADEAALRRALLQIPDKVADACRAENCDILLLSGDLFDGKPSPEGLHVLKLALQEVGVPTFIAPGNHDFCSPDSPWLTEAWPENVHIFTQPHMESVALPQLDCRIYGAGFDAMHCPPLLKGFHTQGEEKYHIAVLHGDPTLRTSDYNPISKSQIGGSGLQYLALGHIHKGDSLREKGTLCAWPGCPMGRGFDELGEKGVLVVTLEQTAQVSFLPLDTPRFYDLQAEVLTDGASALAAVLPAAGSEDYYRVELVGESEPLDIPGLQAQFSQFPHLILRDHTVPVADLWGCIGEDSLEGVYFKMLHDALEGADDRTCQQLLLAAKISRRILDGREVQLP